MSLRGPSHMHGVEVITGHGPSSKFEFSLVRGGPFTRTLAALRLVRTDRYDLVRVALEAALGLWFPFFLCSLVDFWTTRKIPPLFVDISTHVRILVSIPAFFVAEGIMHERTAYVAERVTD